MNDTKTERQLPRLRASHILIGIVVVVISIAAVMAEIAVRPVHGHLTQSDLKLQTAKTAVTMPRTAAGAGLPSGSITSDYFILKTPSTYKIQNQSTSTPGTLYTASLIRPSADGSEVIAIAVKRMSATLADDTAYSMRHQNPGRYTDAVVPQDGDSLHLVSDTQSGGFVVFWPHDNYLATISVSSPITGAENTASLRATAWRVISAWQWR